MSPSPYRSVGRFALYAIWSVFVVIVAFLIMCAIFGELEQNPPFLPNF